MRLICYLSNGYPSLKHSVEMLSCYVDAGCDVVEVDFPPDDPYLEPPHIKRRMLDALKACDDYDQYFDAVRLMRERHLDFPFFCLIYDKTIMAIGVDKFVRCMYELKMMDVICIGNEYLDIKRTLMESGLRVSCFVPFNLAERDVEIAQQYNGFIYMQAKPGEINSRYPTLKDCIEYLRKDVGISLERPVYCGVGVRTPEDIMEVKKSGGDGVFVGNTVLKVQNDIPEMKKIIRMLKKATL